MWVAVGIVCAMLVSGAIFERHYFESMQSEFPAPGTFVNVGSERVHLDISAQTNKTENQPTLVFLAGLGNSPLAFSWIIEELQSEYQTIAYDRPGTGWNSASQKPPTAGYAADILSEALEDQSITQPVVLVAHSYGGLVARVFASRYPDKVSGIVFVDSSHEDQIERLPGAIGVLASLMMHKATVQKWAAQFGLLRLPNAISDEGVGLPLQAQNTFNAIMASAENRAGSQAEAAQWPISKQQARRARNLGDIPISVLVADQWPQAMVPTWFELQSEIASWSSNSALDVLEGASHVTVVYSKSYSAQVSQSIRELSSRL